MAEKVASKSLTLSPAPADAEAEAEVDAEAEAGADDAGAGLAVGAWVADGDGDALDEQPATIAAMAIIDVASLVVLVTPQLLYRYLLAARKRPAHLAEQSGARTRRWTAPEGTSSLTSLAVRPGFVSVRRRASAADATGRNRPEWSRP
jgi:hypothetical protein